MATARNRPVSLSLFANLPVSDIFALRVRVSCSLADTSASHPTQGGEELSHTRWKREQLIRAQTADLDVQKGTNIHQTRVKVVMRCRVQTCHATFVFDLQPCSGFWKLNKHLEHANECFGQVVPAPGASPPNWRRSHNKACARAYTARQVARCISEEASNAASINSKTMPLLKVWVYIVANRPTRTTGPSEKSSTVTVLYQGLVLWLHWKGMQNC